MEPTRLGPYAIRARLGRGGMGAVYEAVDESSGDVVAVKTLATHLSDDTALRRRFGTEIETLKSLRHPGIVRLLAFGEDDGQPYFAMELVRGRSLEQLLRAGRRFTWRETVATALEVTRALKAAHDHGIVHRDLKPANLLFADEPADGLTVKLADFGIARLFGDAGHTIAGMVVGTAEYMAPEQAAGRPADHRADLYALGLVMFAMLAGRPPFRGGQPQEVIERQRREAPPRISSIVPDVPPELDALIDRLLAKDPAARPASALALGRLLTAIDAVQVPGDTVAGAAESPTAGAPVDLLADTLGVPARSGPAVITADATRRAVAADSVTRPAPETGAAGGSQDTSTAGSGGAAPQAARFTTVADLDRTSRALAERAARRDRLRAAATAAAMLAALAAIAWVALRPESADDLHGRIMTIARDDEADLRDARPLIERFLARHAADPRSAAIRDLERTLDLDALERRARRRPLASHTPEPLERDYRAAMAREPESPTACRAALEAILDVHAASTSDDELWLALVRRQLERIAPLAEREQADDLARIEAALAEAADLAREADAATDPARRAELAGRRRELLAGIVEMYGPRPHAAAAVARAKADLAAPAPP